MINRLTKNFSFIEDNRFKINKKDEIIGFIEKAERMKEVDNCITYIQNALECIINDYIERHDLNISLKDTLGSKIKSISDDTRIEFATYTYAIMREINSARNFEQHKHVDKNQLPYIFDKFDVIKKLKNLFVIIKYLYQDEIQEIITQSFDQFNFDNNIYIKDLNINKNISAISEEERRKNSYFSNEHDLIINHDNIKSWLSIPYAKIIIPIYQRKYEWEKENIMCLLEDILSRTKDGQSHYFGTIAQKKIMADRNDEPNQIKIIDGQQRLTTSLLIVCACRDYLKKHFRISEMDWYNDILNSKKYNKLEDYIYNPGGTNENNEIFRKILTENLSGLEKWKNNNFWKNYETIYKFLEENFKQERYVIDFILIFLNNFHVASINFDNNKFPNKKEMELFENLNTKGKELSISDLAKNHIFNFCNNDLLNSKENEIAHGYNATITNTKIIDKNKDDLETFYDILAELHGGEELPKNNKRIKFQSIKESINYFLKEYENVSTIKDFERMLNYLESYIFIYKEICSDDVTKKFLKFLKIEKIVNIISNKKKTRLFTYFAFIIYKMLKDNYQVEYENLGNNKNSILTKEEIQNIQKMFLSICKFVIKTKIITNQGDSSIKRELIRIANENFDKGNNIINVCQNIINNIKKLSNEKYNFNQFMSKLHDSLETRQANDLLILTEYFMNDSLLDEGEQIKRESREIEHIMPQSIDKWIKELDETKKQEYKEKWNIFKNKIGNYLLITRRQNKKATNELFLFKKENVYKNLSSPLYINNIYDNIDVSKKNDWTFDNIERRSNELIKYIVNNVITEND